MRFVEEIATFSATVQGGKLAPLDRKLKSIGEMHAWVEANIGDLLSNGAGRLIAFEAAFVQAKRDGVKRLEIDIAASTACSLRFWARYNPDRFHLEQGALLIAP